MYEFTIKQYNYLFDNGYHNQAAYKVADELGLRMKILGSEYKLHFPGDKQQRYVFKIKLIKGGKQYTFEFGQSISEGSSEPTLYSVLACLTKYDPETFEDFCANYGYDEDSRNTEKTYKAVVKEFNNMQRLFTIEELDLLSIIS